MNRIKLSDEEWTRILAILKKLPGVHIGLPDICRQFVNAILWILRTGAQWRVLPSTYGKWNSVFKRFSRGCVNGIWGKKLCHLSEDADLQDVSMDGQSLGRMPARLERQIAQLRMKRWGVPKAGLVVRFMRFVMPWACQ